MKDPIRLGLFGFLLVALSACTSQEYSIAELFERKDCTGDCYVAMPCEGKDIQLRIYLTGSNALKNGNQYFIRDENDISKTIKVIFDESVPAETYDRIRDEFDKYLILKGHLEGYDLLNRDSCKRAHMVTIQTEDDIIFE